MLKPAAGRKAKVVAELSYCLILHLSIFISGLGIAWLQDLESHTIVSCIATVICLLALKQSRGTTNHPYLTIKMAAIIMALHGNGKETQFCCKLPWV